MRERTQATDPCAITNPRFALSVAGGGGIIAAPFRKYLPLIGIRSLNHCPAHALESDTIRIGWLLADRCGWAGSISPSIASAVGHSDADALLHAVTDALLGAAALGDIGEMFPDTDPANRGRDSGQMLQAAWREVAGGGFRIVNLDCIVFAEKPKLSPHKQQIRQRIAALLGISAECVGLKAKTGEAVGPVGRREAIVAECVVLLETRLVNKPSTKHATNRLRSRQCLPTKNQPASSTH